MPFNNRNWTLKGVKSKEDLQSHLISNGDLCTGFVFEGFIYLDDSINEPGFEFAVISIEQQEQIDSWTIGWVNDSDVARWIDAVGTEAVQQESYPSLYPIPENVFDQAALIVQTQQDNVTLDELVADYIENLGEAEGLSGPGAMMLSMGAMAADAIDDSEEALVEFAKATPARKLLFRERASECAELAKLLPQLA